VGALRLLSCIAPTLALLGGSSSDSALQYASVDLRDACEEDEKRYKGKMRLGTASALLELSSHLDKRLGSVQIPFLALHGTDDKVVHVSSSRRLLKEAASEDAQLIEYEGARHTVRMQRSAHSFRSFATSNMHLSCSQSNLSGVLRSCR